ncbi:MAG: molybdenum cofactor guanylyltransferase [Anaerolineae bacterium]|nr:molybdenum cofactor guanylyltransferase [Anaerolineae bacterium]
MPQEASPSPGGCDRVVGAVLAGGRSQRMGADKASLRLGGRPLAAWPVWALRQVVEEVWLVGGDRALADELGVGYTPDLWKDAGPLGGVYSALRASAANVLVVGCDMPLIQPALLAALLETGAGYDAAVPVKGGECEPLLALYRSTCLPGAEAALARGQRRVIAMYDCLRVRRLTEPDWRAMDPRALSFFNVNTPDDLKLAETLVAEASANMRLSPISPAPGTHTPGRT